MGRAHLDFPSMFSLPHFSPQIWEKTISPQMVGPGRKLLGLTIFTPPSPPQPNTLSPPPPIKIQYDIRFFF